MLSNKHANIRAKLLEDYMNLLSKLPFDIMKRDLLFDPKEETTLSRLRSTPSRDRCHCPHRGLR